MTGAGRALAQACREARPKPVRYAFRVLLVEGPGGDDDPGCDGDADECQFLQIGEVPEAEAGELLQTAEVADGVLGTERIR